MDWFNSIPLFFRIILYIWGAAILIGIITSFVFLPFWLRKFFQQWQRDSDRW